MNTITGLSAQVIPQREFPTRRWFYADPLWYYHGSAGPRPPSGDVVFDLIDPELRDICRLLLDAGLRTTPSCQGHFYPRDHFERVWCELNREAAAIRKDGLCVRDSETDRPFLFRYPVYDLPWPDFETFWREAGAEQHKGYLGVLVPSDHEDVRNALANAPYAGRCGWMIEDAEAGQQLGAVLFSIFVAPVSPRDRAAEWAGVARYFERAVATMGHALQRS
jgi:hypothetical protein